MANYSKSQRRIIITTLAGLLLIVAGYSLTIGAIPTDFYTVATRLPAAVVKLFSPDTNPLSGDAITMVIAEIRLPRLLLGLLVGAGLAVGGAVMQGLFRNPMADPGLLGVSSGAAFGAMLTLVLGAQWFGEDSVSGNWQLPITAFGGGLLCLIIVQRAAAVNGKTAVSAMLLSGIAVNAICAAGVGLLSYIAAEMQLRNFIFWSLGSLEIVDSRKLLVAAICIVPALFYLLRYNNALNANLLGEREAEHLGFDMEKVKLRLVILVALIVGAAVSFSGVISFVGLIVPHLIRLSIGPDHRLLLPSAALFGATLLIGADIIARTAVAPAEIPIGILTALLGGPFFLYLLIRFQRTRPI